MQTLGKTLTHLVGAATVFTVATATQIAVQPAQAASLTFDLTGSASTASFFDFTVDDVTLTATGSDADGNALDVRQTGLGLGVVDGTGPINQIDGRQNSPETLLLALDQRVRILSAVFSRVNTENNANDDFFELLINGGEVTFLGALPPGPGNNELFTFGAPVNNIVGTQFDFSVIQPNDDYSLRSVTFATVPEPASILGLIAVAAAVGTGLQKKQNVA